MNKLGLGCCLNGKVVGGLAAVALGLWVVAPHVLAASLPLLIMAICPLSMLFMMRGMGKGQESSQGTTSGSCCAPRQDSRAAVEPLQVSRSRGVILRRDEELAQLKEQLASTRDEYTVMAREIERLEGRSTSVVGEAEAVARTADKGMRA